MSALRGGQQDSQNAWKREEGQGGAAQGLVGAGPWSPWARQGCGHATGEPEGTVSALPGGASLGQALSVTTAEGQVHLLC